MRRISLVSIPTVRHVNHLQKRYYSQGELLFLRERKLSLLSDFCVTKLFVVLTRYIKRTRAVRFHWTGCRCIVDGTRKSSITSVPCRKVSNVPQALKYCNKDNLAHSYIHARIMGNAFEEWNKIDMFSVSVSL